MANQMISTLQMKKISISFPGVQALSEVDFTMMAGTTHALIGANGAGKSTLMKVLAGAYSHHTGDILIDGKNVNIHSPKDAKQAGIQIVYQEVDTALIPYLSVAENIMLEDMVHGTSKSMIMNWSKIHQKAQSIIHKLGLSIPTTKLVQELTLAEKQLVLIARATMMECKFLILDEPTAPLSDSETRTLFTLIRRLKAEGVGIIFISHRLPELFEICDDITILRDGKHVITTEIQALSASEVAQYMLGSQLGNQYPERNAQLGDIALEAKDIADGDKVHGVDLYVRKGEIIGLAGLVGAGKTELCRILFGASKLKQGDIKLEQKSVKLHSPHDAVREGMAMIPEERRREGIFVDEEVSVNLTVAHLTPFTRLKLWLSQTLEKQAAYQMINQLSIKTPSEKTFVRNLSGGNQQKIAIGKWLLSNAQVYIFDEPTKGVDVGAKKDIYFLIARLAEEGKAVIFASSETNEIVGITDRVYVMYDGKVAKELLTKDTTEEEILYYSTGGR